MSKKYKLPGGGYAGAGYFDDDIWAREKFFSDLVSTRHKTTTEEAIEYLKNRGNKTSEPVSHTLDKPNLPANNYIRLEYTDDRIVYCEKETFRNSHQILIDILAKKCKITVDIYREEE